MRITRHALLRYFGQALAYTALAVVLGYFSSAPVYTHMPAYLALIKISFSHAGQRVRECRRLSAQEIAELAPNMRRPSDCPRERVALLVELDLDGERLYRGVHVATGLWNDGPSTVYQRIAVKPGKHHLLARLRDSRRTDDGFDYQRGADIELLARQNFVVDFRPNSGGFIFR